MGEPADEGGQGRAPKATGHSAAGGERGKNLQEAREMLGLLGTTTKALQEAWAKPQP